MNVKKILLVLFVFFIVHLSITIAIADEIVDTQPPEIKNIFLSNTNLSVLNHNSTQIDIDTIDDYGIKKITLNLSELSGLNMEIYKSELSNNIYENFTIIVLPDTQTYSLGCPEVFVNQTEWIVKQNPLLTVHLGDIVHNIHSLDEWDNANRSLNILDNNSIMYGVVAGNHDIKNENFTWENYDKYFTESRFNNTDMWGGTLLNGTARFYYYLFDKGGEDYLVLFLSYFEDENISNKYEVIDWANEILTNYSDRKVILVTHSYLYFNGTYTAEGEDIYNNILVNHNNSFLVLCGHWYDEYSNVRYYDDEHYVYELLSNYQKRDDSGLGLLRIMKFFTNLNKIQVRTYSPYHDRYERDSDSEFNLGSVRRDSILMTVGTTNWTGNEIQGLYWCVGDECWESNITSGEVHLPLTISDYCGNEVETTINLSVNLTNNTEIVDEVIIDIPLPPIPIPAPQIGSGGGGGGGGFILRQPPTPAEPTSVPQMNVSIPIPEPILISKPTPEPTPTETPTPTLEPATTPPVGTTEIEPAKNEISFLAYLIKKIKTIFIHNAQFLHKGISALLFCISIFIIICLSLLL